MAQINRWWSSTVSSFSYPSFCPPQYLAICDAKCATWARVNLSFRLLARSLSCLHMCQTCTVLQKGPNISKASCHMLLRLQVPSSSKAKWWCWLLPIKYKQSGPPFFAAGGPRWAAAAALQNSATWFQELISYMALLWKWAILKVVRVGFQLSFLARNQALFTFGLKAFWT